MPSRNIIKHYVANGYYHIYSRGVAKQDIFLDAQDYGYFLQLFKRYLSNEQKFSKARVAYPHYAQRLELFSFCLMANHFHMLIHQKDEEAMQEFLKSIMTSYAMYFNKRYKRVGPIFQSRYKASLIDRDAYLDHISRYIHLNPKEWKYYPFSSLQYYIGKRSAEWIQTQEIMSKFTDSSDYLKFLEDYEDQKGMLDELKWELANEI